MSVYHYRAKKSPTDAVSGQLEAASREEAVEKIIRMGYVPVRVDAEGQPGGIAGSGAMHVSGRAVTQFNHQLAVLLKSGVPILKALTILAEQMPQRRLRRIIDDIRADMQTGKHFSEALTRFPGLFPAMERALVQAGEAGGKLQEALVRIAEYRRRREKLAGRVRAALAYPVFMAVVGCATVLFMLMVVMPRLLVVFERLGQDLPAPTKALLKISHLLGQGQTWVVIVFAVLAVSAAFFYGLRSAAGRRAWDALVLRLPGVGGVAHKRDLVSLSYTLQMLLGSGLPFLRALQISLGGLRNSVLQGELRQGIQAVEQGASFGDVLDKSTLFPRFMVNLVRVGEESGYLEESLAEVAKTYEDEIGEALEIFTGLLEPLMILVMGAVIGSMIIAMLLPVFQLNMNVS
ncbi:MAG: type II secretion system F family protein [Candidatus Omnitrophica bacterium]|nr:type II secretion system F family protein [Candidatus Omnitrophota bacterium]